jgi:hypothetical protein
VELSKVIKIKAKHTKQRRCLACGNSFDSEGPHNRICRRCKSSKVWRDGTQMSAEFKS